MLCTLLLQLLSCCFVTKNSHHSSRNEAQLFICQSSELVFGYSYEAFIRFEVFTVMKIRILVAWFVALCSSVGGLKCFGGRYHIHLQNGSRNSMFHLYVGTNVAYYRRSIQKLYLS